MSKKVVCVTAALTLAACGGGLDYEQSGYFKDDRDNRIMSFSIPSDAQPAQVREHAERQMHTAGQLTGLYYWYEGAAEPGQRLSATTGVIEANELLDQPDIDDWAFAAIVSPDGTFGFSDCTADPEDVLCKQPPS